MGSDDLLVMAMASLSLVLSAKVWWTARHAVDALNDSVERRVPGPWAADAAAAQTAPAAAS